MTLPVTFYAVAEADVDSIISFLQLNAQRGVAAKYARRFSAAFDQLSAFPHSGSPRPRLGKGVRILVENPYLIVYRVLEDRVLILRVLDGRRRITRRLVSGRG